MAVETLAFALGKLMTSRWRDTLISPQAAIRDALVRLGKGRSHILMVIDDNGRLLGTVTDGDVRRAFLRSVSLEMPVSEVMFHSPKTVTLGTDEAVCLSIMRRHNILQLPVVDAGGHVLGLVLMEDLVPTQTAARPNWVVLMAGGRGERLRPLTERTPKPMLEVGGQSILETILAHLIDHGLHHIYISVNYKAEQVKDKLGDGGRLGVEIRYLEEDRPLGTAGALSLIREHHTEPLLVVNADLLTKVNFSNLLTHHQEFSAAATVCVREFDVQVPFGVMRIERVEVRDIIEKPVNRFMVNAGIYVLEPSIVARVLPDTPVDMPDILRSAIADGHRVIAFPVYEYWADVGRIEDYQRVSQEFGDIFHDPQ